MHELEFTETSLSRFYLYDVLLHELGHHVDRRERQHDRRASENYAKWFAEVQARSLAESAASASRLTTG